MRAIRLWPGLSMAIVVAAATTAHAQLTPSQKARRTPVVEVFERTKDAVVNIAATQVVEQTIRFSPFDELFDSPLLPQRKQRYTRTSLGSGAVIHPDGYVITNAHVVARAAALKIIFANQTEHEAETVAVDEKHDLAVLRITGKERFPAITMGRSHDLMIGETVVAIGNPLGYQHTVTAGIISALHRRLEVGEEVAYEDLIQTDTSINRGNSGGPLLNVLGELIGLTTAIRSDAQNIGFAIPVDTIRKLLPDMLSLEQRRRLEIGLRLGWRDRVYVVEATGPAAEAGIEPGDDLISVDDHPVNQDIDFYIHTLGLDADKTTSLTLKRNGRAFTARVRPRPIPIPDGAKLLREKFGLVVEPLTAAQARTLDLKGGLLITGIEPRSPAAEAGFRTGLIVVQMGRYFPTDLEGVGLMLERVRRGEKLRVRVYEVYRQYIQVLEGELVAR